MSIALSATGHVPKMARAFSASCSESANAGEAKTIPGPSMPISGRLRVALDYNSTRRSTSALMPRAQVYTSSASSHGYTYTLVPHAAGRG